MRHGARAGLVAVASLLGCGGRGPSPAAPPPQPVGAPVASVAPPDPDRIAVAIVRAPPAFVLDGAIAEWGSLAGPLVSPAERARLAAPPPFRRDFRVDPSPEELAAAGPQATNPTDAGSFVAIAVSADLVRVALDVGGDASEGVWLGIGSPPPPVPPIGEYTRGGGFDGVECTANRQDYVEGMRVITSEPNPPEVIAACKDLLERHAQLQRRHAARFQRRLRIDRAGVRVQDEHGALAPVNGAELRWRSNGARATAEATLPLAALPRLSEAPLFALELLARPASARDALSAPRTAWVRASLPEPLSFPPRGALRARVFEPRPDDPESYHEYWPPLGLSYHPGDPAHVESLRWADGTSSVVPRVEVLYEPKATLDDVEVGIASAAERHVAIFRRGELVDVLPRLANRGIIQRHGEIHVFEYEPATFLLAMGMFVPPRWSVLAILPNGTHRLPLVPFGEEGGPWCIRSEDEVEIASRSLDSVGYRITCVDYEQSTPIEVRWRWDERSGNYLPSWRTLGKPKVRSL